VTHGVTPGVTRAATPVAPAVAPPTVDVSGVESRRCANCGAEAAENYCPRCGQETHDLHRSLAGILGEMLDALAGWDGKIPRTLWLMVRRPGALTTEFLAGRRARYLRPLRLYLMTSVLFFVSLSLLRRQEDPVASGAARSGAPAQVNSGAGGISASAGSRGGIRLDPGADALIERHRNDRGAVGSPAWLKRRFVGGLARIKDLPKAEQQRVLRDAFAARAPNMVFVLLPVFALLLRALYRRAPVFYAEHFVFALHNHAFAYLALTVARATSVWLGPVGLSELTIVPLLWMPVYFFVSMRRVYGGSRVRTLGKLLALGVTYGAILFAATIATMVISLLSFA
jgi:hypothetical protein